jgi:phenylpropionate dioxygenase-like ring-hydroxylating dioxygenase large terminal subunit
MVMLVTQEPTLRRHWHPVAESDAVFPGPLRVRLLGQHIVVWRSDGFVRGAFDRCPHRGAALSGGWVDGACLVCPYHAWSYGCDGKAVKIPQLDDDMPIPPRARLRTVHVEERYGYVWVAIDEPVADIPPLPGVGEPGWRVIPEFFETWYASAPRIIDNSLDIAHTAVVHRATIGDFSKPRVHPYTIEQTATGFRARMPVDAQGVEVQGAEQNGAALRDVTVEIVGPLAFVADIRYGTGVSHVIFTMATPVDDAESLFVQFVARNDAADEAADEAVVALDRRVTIEDKVIVELTDPDFPLDATSEVHLRCDRVTLEYRRYLSRMLRSVDEAAGIST